jgi:outer membrane protein insertion porin family
VTRNLILWALLAGAALLVPPEDAAAAVIRVVDFESAPRLVEYDLPRMVTLHPGDEYSADELERNRRLLEATGLFRSISAEAVEEAGGYRVIFRVVPYELIERVSVAGNFFILKKNLVRSLRAKIGDPFREETARSDAMALLRAYENDGYRGTQVQTEVQRGRKGVQVLYRIREGEPGVIRKLEFRGNDSVTSADLTPLLRMTLFTFFGNEKLQDSVDRVEQYYRDRGYLDVSVTAEVERGEGIVPPAFTLMNPIKGLATLLPGQYEVVDITLAVEEGSHYRLETEGNEKFSDDDLRPLLSFSRTGFFDEHEAGESREDILVYYRERGYFRAAVDLDFDRENDRVVFTVTEGIPYELTSLDLQGVEFFEKSDILSLLQSWKTGIDGSRPLRPDHLQDDAKMLIDHYRFEGFLDVEVLPPSIRLDGATGGAAVVFLVREGARSLVEDVAFDGVTAVEEEELRELLKSGEGLPFRPGWVTGDKEQVLRVMSARGYPHCRVREEISFSGDRRRVGIRFLVDLGDPETVGTILVVGNRKTKRKVILREVPLRSSDPYRVSDLARAKRNLYGLGYFDEVTLKTPEPVGDGVEQDLVIRVRERPTGLARLGVGYGSRERFRGFVEVGERNLFGKGRGLSLRAQASTINRRYDLFFREPWPFGYRINSEADVFEEFREEKAYDVISRGVSVGVKKKFRERYTVNLRYRFELVEYDNVAFEFDDPLELAAEVDDLEPINISSGIALVAFDLRDHPVTPHKGSHHLFGVEVATPYLGGDTAFNKYTFETSWYLPLTERSELAVGFRGGFSQTFTGFESLPLSERFFLGGARGVRGWPEDEVGPKDDAGNPTGGDAYALGIAEYRFPLGRKNWRGVLFFDAGNVWTSVTEIEPTKAKYGFGVGLRYNTLVGPLRLDYGFKLNPDPGEAPGRIYFNIGFPI